MKNQALFSSKDESKKKIKCRLLQFLFGALSFKDIYHSPVGTHRSSCMVLCLLDVLALERNLHLNYIVLVT